MIRELKIAVSASGKEAQYDEHAKNIAGQKFIIANILAKSVEAFRGMKPKDIIPYIEGEPYISKVPVDPNLPMPPGRKTGIVWSDSTRKIRKSTRDWYGLM